MAAARARGSCARPRESSIRRTPPRASALPFREGGSRSARSSAAFSPKQGGAAFHEAPHRVDRFQVPRWRRSRRRAATGRGVPLHAAHQVGVLVRRLLQGAEDEGASPGVIDVEDPPDFAVRRAGGAQLRGFLLRLEGWRGRGTVTPPVGSRTGPPSERLEDAAYGVRGLRRVEPVRVHADHGSPGMTVQRRARCFARARTATAAPFGNGDARGLRLLGARRRAHTSSGAVRYT